MFIKILGLLNDHLVFIGFKSCCKHTQQYKNSQETITTLQNYNNSYNHRHHHLYVPGQSSTFRCSFRHAVPLDLCLLTWPRSVGTWSCKSSHRSHKLDLFHHNLHDVQNSMICVLPVSSNLLNIYKAVKIYNKVGSKTDNDTLR